MNARAFLPGDGVRIPSGQVVEVAGVMPGGRVLVRYDEGDADEFDAAALVLVHPTEAD